MIEAAALTVRQSPRRFNPAAANSAAGFDTPPARAPRRSPEPPFFVPAISMVGRVEALRGAVSLAGSVNSARFATLFRLTPDGGDSSNQQEEAATMATVLPDTAPAVQAKTLTTIQFPAGLARHVVCVGSGAEILSHRALSPDEIVISQQRLDEIVELANALRKAALAAGGVR